MLRYSPDLAAAFASVFRLQRQPTTTTQFAQTQQDDVRVWLLVSQTNPTKFL